MTTTDNLKQQWRNKLRKLTSKSLSDKDNEQLLALPEITHAKHIGCYIAIQPEIDLTPFYHALIALGKKLYIPTLDKSKKMCFIEYDPFQSITMSQGFQTEHHTPLFEADKLDCIIVPCLGIDQDNKRLGRGQGYYDRILNDASITISIIMKQQRIQESIGKSHDVTIKRIVEIN